MADQKVETVFQDKEVVAFLKSMNTRLKKIKNGEKRFVGLLSAIVYKDIITHFEEEQGPQGPWAEWSEGYKNRLDKIGRGNNKILQFDGKLRQNFTPQDWRNTSQGIQWFNNAQTRGGFPYAAAHDEGGDKLPQRSFMWLSGDAAEQVARDTLAFMLEEGV